MAKDSPFNKLWVRICGIGLICFIFSFITFCNTLPWLYTYIAGTRGEILVKVTGWSRASGIGSTYECSHPEVNNIHTSPPRGLCVDPYNRYKYPKGTTLRLKGRISRLGINISDMEIESVRLFEAGLADSKAGNYQSAVDNFSEAIPLNPNDAGLYIARGVNYTNLGQHMQAAEDYNKAIHLKPDDASVYILRSKAYVQLGQNELAMNDADKAISLKPDSADAYQSRGLVYTALGQFQDAVYDFNKAISLKPGYAVAHINRGNAYAKLGQFQKSVEDYDNAISLKTDYVEAYHERALSYSRLGQYQKATKDYEKAISLEPANMNLHRDFSEYLIIAGRPDQAESEADITLNAANSLPDKAVGYYLKAVSRHLQGKDTAETDAALRLLVANEFQFTWKFEEIENWIKQSKITNAQKTYIRDKIALLKKHFVPVPAQNQVSEMTEDRPSPV